MSDHRTNEEIARAIWREQLRDIKNRRGFRQIYDDLDEDIADAIDNAQIAIIMAALADVRGVGTA